MSSSRERDIEFEEGGGWIVGTGVTGDIARINLRFAHFEFQEV